MHFIYYYKFFITKGPPDSNKTVFVRQSSTVVCTAGVAHTMMIEPRDEYNNLCTFGNNDRPTDGYDVKIVQVNIFVHCLSHLKNDLIKAFKLIEKKYCNKTNIHLLFFRGKSIFPVKHFKTRAVLV